MNTSKKITLATLKSFVRKNRHSLLIKQSSSFDGMTDCVRQTGDTFGPAQTPDNSHPAHDLGIRGAWIVGGSRDYFTPYNADGLSGIRVSNCCGSFTVAIVAQEGN